MGIAGGKLAQNIGHRDAYAANAGMPAHLPGIDGNAFQPFIHGFTLTSVFDFRTQRLGPVQAGLCAAIPKSILQVRPNGDSSFIHKATRSTTC